MGAWETDLIGNDEVQDFFIDIEEIIGIEDLSILIIEKECNKIKNIFLKKRNEILSTALNYEQEVILSYIGLLKIMNIEINNDEKKHFAKALKYEYERINSWDEPDLRKSYLKALEVAIKENTEYNFSMKI
jgi:rubrerythrin